MFMPALEKAKEQDTILMIPAGWLRKPKSTKKRGQYGLHSFIFFKKRPLFVSIMTKCRRSLGNQEFQNILLSSETGQKVKVQMDMAKHWAPDWQRSVRRLFIFPLFMLGIVYGKSGWKKVNVVLKLLLDTLVSCAVLATAQHKWVGFLVNWISTNSMELNVGFPLLSLHVILYLESLLTFNQSIFCLCLLPLIAPIVDNHLSTIGKLERNYIELFLKSHWVEWCENWSHPSMKKFHHWRRFFCAGQFKKNPFIYMSTKVQ